MAGFFREFLKGAADGFLGSPYLKDYKHASKIFTTNAYGNAPKYKWLFHVYFDINKTAITDQVDLIFPSTANYGVLVKSIDLPKYQIQVEQLNQYNRKRFIQTKINYDPIRVVFHDDNANQIRQLWYTYFSYYYNDTRNPINISNFGGNINRIADADNPASKLSPRNIYKHDIQGQENWGYIGDITQANLSEGISQKTPFFKSIKIFGFNQHNFAMYQLINPIIDSFGHDTYSYSETTGTMENSMSIKYETVKYYDGALNGQKPQEVVQGFAQEGLYDTELSPISRPGNNKNILGKGGLLESGAGILDVLKNPNATLDDYRKAIQTAGRLGRTFKNPQSILQAAKTEIVGEVVSAITNPTAARSGFSFPAWGAVFGNRSQQGSSTNPRPTQPPPIDTPGNNQISGGL